MRKTLLFTHVLCVICSAALANDQWDLSSPEAALAGYIESLRHGNVEGVLARYHNADWFHLPGPVSIEDYEVVNKVIFGAKEVEAWNIRREHPCSRGWRCSTRCERTHSLPRSYVLIQFP